MAEVRDAEITIVGGGAIGCAVAYCLARAARDRAELVYETYYGLAAAAQGGR